jgi:hypothetical protein
MTLRALSQTVVSQMTARAIIYNDGRWWLAIFDGNKSVIKMELRSENGWSLLRSLVEMLAA